MEKNNSSEWLNLIKSVPIFSDFEDKDSYSSSGSAPNDKFDESVINAKLTSDHAKLDNCILPDISARQTGSHSGAKCKKRHEENAKDIAHGRWRIAIDSFASYSKWDHRPESHNFEDMPTLDETDDKDGDDEVHSREEDYFISMPASEFMNQFERSAEEIERLQGASAVIAEMQKEWDEICKNENITETFKKKKKNDEINVLLICFACGRVFGEEAVMRDHINSMHLADKNYAFKCTICHRRFKRKHHLKRHEEHIHSHTKYRCNICAVTFKVQSTLAIHRSRVHHVGENGEEIEESYYKCQRCNLKFGTLFELTRHKLYCLNKQRILQERKERAKIIVAEASNLNCSGIFNPTIADRPRLDTTCPFCLIKFASMQSLKRHIGRKHADNEANNIRKYETVYSPDLPFSCHICAKRFASAASLTYHKKRHDGDRPFACEICGKTYPIPSELRKHVRRVHGGVEETSTAVANIEVKCSEDHEKINGNVCGEKSLNYDDLTDFIL